MYDERIIRGYSLGLLEEFIRQSDVIRQATFQSDIQ